MFCLQAGILILTITLSRGFSLSAEAQPSQLPYLTEVLHLMLFINVPGVLHIPAIVIYIHCYIYIYNL